MKITKLLLVMSALGLAFIIYSSQGSHESVSAHTLSFNEVIGDSSYTPMAPVTTPVIKEFESIENHIPSFVGTNVAGVISFVDGRLEQTRNLRRVFDYFLTLRGMKDDDFILQTLSQYLGAYSESEKELVLEAYSKYLALIKAESELDVSLGDDWTHESLLSFIEERRRLRRETLGESLSESFFGEQERYEDFQYAQIKNSSGQDKVGRVLAEELLSPKQFRQRMKTYSLSNLKNSNELDSEEHIVEYFGSEALERLERAQDEVDEWQEKRRRYLSLKDSVWNRDDLSDKERESELRVSALDFLEGHEYLRMQALDSII